VDSLPAALRTKIGAIGEAVIDYSGGLPQKDATWSTVRSHIRKISTGEAAPLSLADLRGT